MERETPRARLDTRPEAEGPDTPADLRVSNMTTPGFATAAHDGAARTSDAGCLVVAQHVLRHPVALGLAVGRGVRGGLGRLGPDRGQDRGGGGHGTDGAGTGEDTAPGQLGFGFAHRLDSSNGVAGSRTTQATACIPLGLGNSRRSGTIGERPVLVRQVVARRPDRLSRRGLPTMSPPRQPAEPMPDHATASPESRWPMAAVLVVDDEPGMRSFLEKTLAVRVGQVHVAEDTQQADALVRRHRFDLVILDIALPGKSGIEWLREQRALGNDCEVVLITAFADLDTAIEALRAGASDFILKPFRLTQILSAVTRGLERGTLRRENWVLRHRLSQGTPPGDGLVGDSIVIKGLQAAIQRVAAVHSTVLLTGETGTGKELVALALHHRSARAPGPFVPVNCATMSPEFVER